MKILTTFIFIIILNACAFAQKTMRSANYGYTIEIPDAFVKKPIIVKNIDLKFANSKGSSIVVVVKKLPQDAVNADVAVLSSFTNGQLVEILSASLDDVKIIKRGLTQINGVKAYYVDITHGKGNSMLYGSNYCLFKGGSQYTVTTTCSPKDRSKIGIYFFRAVQSLSL